MPCLPDAKLPLTQHPVCFALKLTRANHIYRLQQLGGMGDHATLPLERYQPLSTNPGPFSALCPITAGLEAHLWQFCHGLDLPGQPANYDLLGKSLHRTQNGLFDSHEDDKLQDG